VKKKNPTEQFLFQLSSLTDAIYLSSCLHEGSPVGGLQCSGWKIHSRNKQNRLTIAQSSNDHISLKCSDTAGDFKLPNHLTRMLEECFART
jgi:hypothetical protein